MIEVDIEKRLNGFHLRAAFKAGNELVSLFGPSGSGKTLTLQSIAGLVRPDEGRIAIGDRVVFDSRLGINLPPQKRRVGYVFQDYALLPHLSVAENIGYGLHALPTKARREKVVEMLDLMRLEGLEAHRPHELSGGQRQRVALARALVIQPSILLLDEPFSALDSAIRSKLRAELLQLLRGIDITAILVTHSLEEAYVLSETMVVYDASTEAGSAQTRKGRVLQIGNREEILYRPASRAVARFTGAKNIFSGTVISAGKDGLEILSEGFSIVSPPYERAVGNKVEFCIRPEHIMLLRPDQGLGARVKENRLRGRIVQEISRGSSFTLLFKIDGLQNGRPYDLQVEIPAHVYQKLALADIKEWVVSLKKDAIHVF